MVDAIVSSVLKRLSSLIQQEMSQQEERLVVGVNKEMKVLTNNLEAIQAVITDAEQKQFKERAVRLWLEKLKEASYHIEDVLDEWSTAMLKLQTEGAENALVPKKKVSFFFSFPCFRFRQVGLRCDIAIKIKDINENLDALAKEKELYNFNVIRTSIDKPESPNVSFVDVSKICGRYDEINNLVYKLCESSEKPEGLHIISIVGMGGIGKTTLAQFACNDDEVINNFDKRIWVCMSDFFDEFKIARTIIEALGGSITDFGDLEYCLQDIRKSITRHKFLLVLDDVWIEDNKWEPFCNCLMNGVHGSKILITTRNMLVAQMMKSVDIITVKPLPDEENWLLFKQLAFFERSSQDCENLEDIGRKIVVKCRGLPLAAKTIGSLLRSKRTKEEWQKILDNEIWELKEFEKCILPPLLLSYNDLSSIMRRCFSYCAIFPKDYVINKDQLIKLWMAQGYFGLEKDKEIEMIGQECFNNLATQSFFQEFEKDCDGQITGCKMHDMVNDFAQFLTKKECCFVKINGDEVTTINSFTETVRHLMLIFNQEAPFPDFIYSFEGLHSLFIDNCHEVLNFSQVLPKVIEQFTFLRTLHIGGEICSAGYSNINNEVPSDIGKLIHLRYLKLSRLDITELPDTICELYNLQTLDISDCGRFKRLPEKIEKLVNLRHLNFPILSGEYMPKGIRQLTCLRSLSKLIVCGSGNDSNACTLDCVKLLNHLRGSLRISGLGNVVNVVEAEEAKLDDKKNLTHLDLYFDEEVVVLKADNERVLHALEPTQSLEELWIGQYKGIHVFPRWIMSLTKLRKLTLDHCINCERLPPFGKLPFLESLRIWKMTSVKGVGSEFLGFESDGTSSSFTSVIVFPILKSLEFSNMEMWEEWDYRNAEKGEEEYITIMPCLDSLKLLCCPKLKALPGHLLRSTTLKTFEIFESPVLEERHKNNISHIPDIYKYKSKEKFARRSSSILIKHSYERINEPGTSS